MTAFDRSPLRGGILAAGQGTRLKADGFASSKAMTPVGGRPLIDHALERFRAVGLRRVTVIINEESDDCRQWLERNAGDLDLDIVVRTTPSSYASFELVARRLAGKPALITTVDSILPVDDFRMFVRSAAAFPKNAVVLGVTTHVNDENPLWATLDAQGRIRALGGQSGSHVTAGLYWLPAIRHSAQHADFARLRDYLQWLAGRAPMYGVALPLVFDIDRACDVEEAEKSALMRQHESVEK
jgi:NDP-sugar pyrophosphorylase family protein